MATIKASDIIKELRAALNDKDETYRWDDTELLGWLGDAQERVATLRPDAAMATSATLAPITAPTALASTLTLDGRWKAAMYWYVLARALASKGGDKENVARGSAAMASFERELRM